MTAPDTAVVPERWVVALDVVLVLTVGLLLESLLRLLSAFLLQHLVQLDRLLPLLSFRLRHLRRSVSVLELLFSDNLLDVWRFQLWRRLLLPARTASSGLPLQPFTQPLDIDLLGFNLLVTSFDHLFEHIHFTAFLFDDPLQLLNLLACLLKLHFKLHILSFEVFQVNFLFFEYDLDLIELKVFRPTLLFL